MKTFDEEKLERDLIKLSLKDAELSMFKKNTSLSDRSVGFKLDTEYLKKHVPMISIIATDMPTPSSLYMAEVEREARLKDQALQLFQQYCDEGGLTKQEVDATRWHPSGMIDYTEWLLDKLTNPILCIDEATIPSNMDIEKIAEEWSKHSQIISFNPQYNLYKELLQEIFRTSATTGSHEETWNAVLACYEKFLKYEIDNLTVWKT